MYKNYYQNYITLDNFDKEKLDFFKNGNQDSVYIVNKDYGFINPQYCYDLGEKIKVASFKFITPFIELDYKINIRTEDLIKINLNTQKSNKLEGLIRMLLQYDKKVDSYINANYNSEHRCVKRLISNNTSPDNTVEHNLSTDLRELTLYFLKDKVSQKITSTILNYNISKKYPKNEEYEHVTYNELKKFLWKGKEMRFILRPITWISKSSNIYGSKLMIEKMEVKFKDAKIDSLIDKNTRDIIPNIKNITI